MADVLGLHTVRCIGDGKKRCYKKVVMSTGHVKAFDGEHVIAGFCDSHSQRGPLTMSWLGCWGEWQMWMGARETKW